MILDILVLIALSYGIYKGVSDGLFVSVASFLSLLIGTIGALKFSNVIKGFLYETVGWDSKFLPVLSFVIAFLITVFLVRLVAQFMTKVFQAVFLGFFNRLTGAVFYILIVALVICLILSLFDQINVNHFLIDQDTLMRSYSYRYYLMVSESVFPDFFKLIQDLFAKSAELIEIPQAEAV
jgi:membrane protein required for colicin V production